MEFHITNIVTGGSPIATFDIPHEVSVLSIEHQQDAVPRPDGGDTADMTVQYYQLTRKNP